MSDRDKLYTFLLHLGLANKDSGALRDYIVNERLDIVPYCYNCSGNKKPILDVPKESVECPKCGHALIWQPRRMNGFSGGIIEDKKLGVYSKDGPKRVKYIGTTKFDPKTVYMTIGNEYDVLGCGNDFLIVLDDKGRRKTYAYIRFEVVAWHS